ncbi:MAG: calcium-binding protein [Xenococcaceae cyanobacterium MO_234.B1]|nr:calcium-binding protein [Xenococcaceae cyanobacterium MO_234.B1]
MLSNNEVMMLSLEQIFNESYYLENNPEAAEAVASGDFASGLEHFEAVGLDEGLRFSPLIDLDYYKVVANPDLTDLSNREALEHLLEVGIEEGRLFSPFVDLEFYQEANSDLADLSNSEALLHLRDIGLDAGLQFSSFVDLEEYRSFGPELADLSLSETFSHLATFYAPEDEGRIRVPLEIGLNIPDELSVFTPEVVAGSGEVAITYSKAANEVIIELDIEGLPYRETFTRPEDVSTPYNQQLVSVEDAKWQLWLNGNWFNIESNFWYDGQTGQLIGNEYNLPTGPVPTDSPLDVNDDGVADTPFSFPVVQAIGSPIFEGNPDGTAQVRLEYTYDQLLDERGTAGVFATVIPYNLNSPSEVGIYYTEGGLPVSIAMTWDEILDNMQNNERVQFALSVEPDPKPSFLDSRPNTMDAWAGFYPLITPDDLVYSPTTDSYRLIEPADLVVHANEPFPARLAETIRESELVFGNSEADEFDAANPSDNFDGNRDTVFTGAGDDFVDASQATGSIFPSTAGRNRIFSGTGLDELLAGKRDRLSGGVGDDILDASIGSGSNRLYGEEGNDELFAGRGDRLFAGAGDDILDATTGNGNNRLYGQDDNDTFFLGSGDRLLGGDGDDAFFVTDGGDNLITGGAGADAFWIATGELITAANTITDFELDADVIGVAGIGATSIEDLEFNQVGNDAVISFSGFDLATLLNTQASALQSSDVFVFA